MKSRYVPILIVLISLGMISLACGMFTTASDSPTPAAALSTPAATLESIPPTPASTAESQETATTPAADALPTLVPALDANGDGQIDICEAVPQSVLEETLGRKLTGPGLPFTDAALGDGCAFDFGRDSNEAYFAYVTLATEKQFTDALANAVKAEPVTTIGDSAFLNYGPDARQLWVRVGKKAVLVAIGDRENVPAEMIFARYLLDFASVPGEITAESFAGTWQSVDSNSNNPRQYCQVDITAQGNMLTIKFASLCNPLTYIDWMTTTVPFDGNPVVAKIKDFQGGEQTITFSLNGNNLNVNTAYVDKDGNPGINITDAFTKK